MQSGQHGKPNEKRESNIRDLWDNIKCANLCKQGFQKEKKKRMENVFEEIVTENFPNLKETDIQIHQAQRAPNKLSPNRLTPRHYYNKNGKS